MYSCAGVLLGEQVGVVRCVQARGPVSSVHFADGKIVQGKVCCGWLRGVGRGRLMLLAWLVSVVQYTTSSAGAGIHVLPAGLRI
jgi:hypothetical protein